jgi:SAM-dependent methyltransferase
MSRLTEWMDRNWYPDSSRNWDDVIFRQRILCRIRPEHSVLDLGAGAGIVSAMNFKGLASKVCGVDLDPRVVENPYLDEGRISDAGRIPFENGQFDLVFSDNVLEHLAEPVGVFREIERVLKPGGVFLFKTPNKWHYMPTVARLTPHRFHQVVNRLRGRAEVDTFPTRYLANSRSAIKKLAQQSGLRLEALETLEGRPEYLRMSAITYFMGMVYERMVNSCDALSMFRILLIGTLKKERDGEPVA